MKIKSYKWFLFFPATLVLLGCGSFGSNPKVIPLEQLGTAIVETSAALASQTALFAPPTSQFPTDTEVPTATFAAFPTSTETSTPFIIIVPSRTATKIPTRTNTTTPLASKTSNQPCMIAAQAPANNTQFNAGAFFDSVWTVVNTSAASWALGNVDFVYSSGSDFHLYNDIQDLPATVNPNQSTAFIVNMQAPASAGTYSETWIVREGDAVHCTMSVTIIVK